MPGLVPSAILGVLGGTQIWGATELPEQEKRVAKGLFAANPRKQARSSAKRPNADEAEGGDS